MLCLREGSIKSVGKVHLEKLTQITSITSLIENRIIIRKTYNYCLLYNKLGLSSPSDHHPASLRPLNPTVFLQQIHCMFFFFYRSTVCGDEEYKLINTEISNGALWSQQPCNFM